MRYLPEGEQVALVKKAQRGDVEARNRLVETSMGLLYRIAHAVKLPRGMVLDELVSAGAFGMIRAIEKFDPARNVKFATYAAYWVRSSIQVECTLWRYERSNLWREKGAIARYHEGIEAGLSEEEALDRARTAGPRTMKATTIQSRVEALRQYTVSIDKPIWVEGSRTTLLQQLPGNVSTPEAIVIDRETQRRIRMVLFRFRSTLRPLQIAILDRRFLDDQDTLAAIARDHGTSRENVRQHEVRLRKALARELDRAGLAPSSERSELPLAG